MRYIKISKKTKNKHKNMQKKCVEWCRLTVVARRTKSPNVVTNVIKSVIFCSKNIYFMDIIILLQNPKNVRKKLQNDARLAVVTRISKYQTLPKGFQKCVF